MRKCNLVVQVNKEAYPEGTCVVEAYFPAPGLAVHREVAPRPKAELLARATRWRRWYITHVSSGLRVHHDAFKRLRDALLACKMIADMLPWTSSADEVIRTSARRKALARGIIQYAREGHSETEIAQLALELELKDGE